MITTLLGSIAVAYLLLLLVLRLSESRLLYVPGERRLDPPAASLPVERVTIPSTDGVTLVAWIMRAASGQRGPLAAHLPWQRRQPVQRRPAGPLRRTSRPRPQPARLRLSGIRESGGKPTEAGLYADAEAAYRYLRDTLRVPPERIVIFGHSLGSAVAVELASHEPAAGLVLDGAFASAVGRAQEVYPYVPVRWIARSRYASIEKIAGVRMPKLFLHARADEVIPFAHGQRLFDAASGPKTFVPLRGGHGDAFDVDSAAYFGAICDLPAVTPS